MSALAGDYAIRKIERSETQTWHLISSPVALWSIAQSMVALGTIGAAAFMCVNARQDKVDVVYALGMTTFGCGYPSRREQKGLSDSRNSTNCRPPPTPDGRAGRRFGDFGRSGCRRRSNAGSGS
jgi:hypothetical protein